MTQNAIRFDPSFETIDPNEDETIRALIETLRGISETTFKDYGHAVRSVHAKAHGLLRGEMQVLESLPEALAQGAFAKVASYPVAMRFSTNPGDVLDDSVSAPRGLALKIVGVEGERLLLGEALDGLTPATQDFVMANAPAFAAPNPKAFLGNLKLLAKTTDTPQIFKKAFSAIMRGAGAVVESVSGPSGLIRGLGGQPMTHLLGDTYYSQVPVLWGPYFGKVSVVPVSPELTALTGTKLRALGHPNALRDAVCAHFAHLGGVWEVRVQLCTDIDAMPVEDASVRWPEDRSPYVAVARIDIPPQPAWSEARAQSMDDGLAFSPWHGLAAHRPLGGIMRARGPAYEMSATFRGAGNGCPIREPMEALAD
jgi:hypothetical protein